MSDFDLNELLPFYLDETDEQIAVLNEALLRLEESPSDAKALQEAFRIAHSIKGSSRLMGFEQVTQLTHHLESYFDQLRGGRRELDRASLDVSFHCLDALRDYHRELRELGQSVVDLSECLKVLLRCIEGAETGPPDVAPAIVAQPMDAAIAPTPEPPTPTLTAEAVGGSIRIIAVFEANLPWKDMKARLILSRLSERVQVVASEPPLDRIEEVETLPALVVWVVAEDDPDELRALADVDGVAEVRIDRAEPAAPPAEPAAVEPAAVEAPPPSSRPLAPEQATEEEEPAAPPTPTRVEGPAAPASGGRKVRIGETLRVDVDRLDNLMNLAGELVINKARFGQIMTGLRGVYGGPDVQLLAADTEDRFDSLARALDHLERATGADDAAPVGRWKAQFRRLRDNVTSMLAQLDGLRQGHDHLQSMTEAMDQLTRIAEGIQKGVLETRMVPIGPLFERFRRVVRDLCASSGKQVELRLGGEATELDKRMIDELADPLVHMIRNAVDHGLEPPAQRAKLGKPPAGTVALQAAHRGNSVVITVTDDGRGIDAERIQRKVVAQGLLREAEARALSERELIGYIWHPGLSTAEQVTDVSGRGVGMDIVKNHIENLSGSVDVRTELGRGTTFTIRLPLTLAILPSLVVRIYDEYYAIPLDAADEIIEVRSAAIRRVYGTATVDNRGRVLPLLELNEVFRWGGQDHPSLHLRSVPGAGAEKSTIVLVQNGETTMGLRVDELVGIQEVVLKSLERNFRPIPGLSGASILGDGRVSLILDIDTVIGVACNGGSPSYTTRARAAAPALAAHS